MDVEVARLKLMKADHQSKQYRLEDQLLKYFPQEIETNKGFIKGFEADLETLAAHPHPEDGFAGMEIRGDVLTDKENAGAALLDACKEVKMCIRDSPYTGLRAGNGLSSFCVRITATTSIPSSCL